MDLNSLTPEQINQIARQLQNMGDQSLPNEQHAEWTKGAAAIELGKVDAANRAHMAKVGSKEHKFPQMLYRALQNESGKYVCMNALPNDIDPRRGAAEAFNAACTMTVGDETERDRFLTGGWSETAEGALAKAELKRRADGQEAGERNHRDRLMSEPARAEVQTYERENFGHHPEIPAQPVKRRGRPKKVQPEAN